MARLFAEAAAYAQRRTVHSDLCSIRDLTTAPVSCPHVHQRHYERQEHGLAAALSRLTLHELLLLGQLAQDVRRRRRPICPWRILIVSCGARRLQGAMAGQTATV
jgi:hypothetical protein